MRTFDFSLKPMVDEAGQVALLIAEGRDITERKRAEEQARRVQNELTHVARVSMMGEMAAGLAHELNQPLAAITNYTHGCIRRLQSGHGSAQELVPTLEKVALQAERAGEIIRRLRTLVRREEPHRSMVHVDELVREIAGFVEAEGRQHDAMVRFELAEDLRPVVADRIQIQQVILNLVRNGCEAMDETDKSARQLTVSAVPASADEVQVSVRDTGQAIAKEKLDRIVEPFFTTKPGGLGMGLAISRSIVEAHGGRLSAELNPECGTTVAFTLPTAKEGTDDEV